MIFYRRSVRDRIGPRERAANVVLLIGLAGIGAWVVARGRQVNPDLFRLKESALSSTTRERAIYRRPAERFTALPESGAEVGLLAPDLLGADWHRDGALEVFGPDQLYEKIDGREGLYKSYGFRRLWTASYVATAAPTRRVDVELFLLGSPMQAFGVLATERQAATIASGSPDMASIPNGLYLVRGAYYARLVGSEASGQVREAAAAAARKLDALATSTVAAAATSSDGKQVPLASLLRSPESWTPASNPLVLLGADPATLRYVATDGLGMDFFKGLYMAALREGGKDIRAYLFPARDPAEAQAVFRKYSEYLTRQAERAAPGAFPGVPAGAVAVRDKVLNTWEWTCQVGRFVTGVTEAEDGPAAARVVAKLEKALQSEAR
ncbi:MAG: hypothetical protein HY303_16770 [Candidatus Wallbacteria bacterium]|nr:hypothetical protein [Candidatus Wallbacteria bacterium]